MINRGISPSYVEKDGVLVYNQKCVRHGIVSHEEARYTNPQKKSIPEDRFLQAFDILINSTGVGTAGRVGQVKVPIKPSTIDSHVTLVRANSDKVIPLFLGYAIKNKQFEIENLAEGSTGQTEISRERLKNIEVQLPPLPEQRAIAEVLSTLDDKIELNRRMNRTLEQLARALFKHWFIDNPEREDWEIGIFSDIAEIDRSSITPLNYPEKSFLHYSIPAYDENKFPVKELGEKILSNKFQVNSDCILVSKLNPLIKRIWFPPFINDNCVCSTEFLVVKPKKEYSKEYLYCFVNEPEFYDAFKVMVTGTSGSHQRVKAEYVVDMPVFIPPLGLIKCYSNSVNSFFMQISNNILQSRTLAELRDTLLPKLMSGKIKVDYEK